MKEPRAAPVLSDAIDAERPPHRLARLRSWMDAEGVDCPRRVRRGRVNYLGGYWRYYGGPSALVLGPGRRPDARRHARRGSASRSASARPTRRGYGERGFGIELVRFPILAEAVGRRSQRSSASSIGRHRGRLRRDERACSASSLPARLVPGRRGVRATAASARTKTSSSKIVHAYELCWLGQRAVNEATQRGASEIEIFTAAQSTAQIAHGEPIEFLADMLSGPDTCEVCCPIRIATDPVGRDRTSPWSRTSSFGRAATGGTRAETHVRGRIPRSRRHAPRCSRSSSCARQELVPGNTGREIFRAMAARIAEAVPGCRVPASRQATRSA